MSASQVVSGAQSSLASEAEGTSGGLLGALIIFDVQRYLWLTLNSWAVIIGKYLLEHILYMNVSIY